MAAIARKDEQRHREAVDCVVEADPAIELG